MPRDTGSAPMVNSPAPFPAIARYGADAAVSSVVTLTDNTTLLEVAAVGGAGVAIRWVPSTDTQASVISMGASANFDHIIVPGEVRRFAVPIERIGTSSIVGANVQNGLYKRVAWIRTAVPSSSVMAAEY